MIIVDAPSRLSIIGTMCTQVWHKYQCGCRRKGEFIQCERLYDLQTNVKCERINQDDVVSRNYCDKHMPTEGKAQTEYHGRVPGGHGR